MWFRNLKEPLKVLNFMVTIIFIVVTKGKLEYSVFSIILQYFLDSKYELTSPRATHLAPDEGGMGMNIGRMCLEWAVWARSHRDSGVR